MRTKVGMAAGRRPIGIARLRNTAAEQLRVIRLTHDNPRFRAALAQHPRDALQRTASAEAGDEIVEAFACEGCEDLRCGRAGVRLGVRFVFELTAQKPAVHLRKFDRFSQHPAALEARRGEHNPRAEKAHQLAAFDAEVLSHCYDQRVAFLGTHHREPDPRVTTSRLDNRLSRFQTAATFGVLDDAERETILDRSHWIECFDLDVQLHVRWGEPLDLDHRRVANRFKDAVKPVLGTIHRMAPSSTTCHVPALCLPLGRYAGTMRPGKDYCLCSVSSVRKARSRSCTLA